MSQKVIPLYNQEVAESVLARLRFEKELIENNEYFAAWFSDTLNLNPEQEKIIRKSLEVPKGEFEGIQRRIQIMDKYTQPKHLEENK